MNWISRAHPTLQNYPQLKGFRNIYSKQSQRSTYIWYEITSHFGTLYHVSCQVYDDDIDHLYKGSVNENLQGLLYWSGVGSSKHDGQLKRICAPVISLLRHLVVMESANGNVFYDRFVQLPLEDVIQVHFAKHIVSYSKSIAVPGQTRNGSSEDALELLAILYNDHRNMEGELEAMDLDLLTSGSKKCKDKLHHFIQKSNADHVSMNYYRPLLLACSALASNDKSRSNLWSRSSRILAWRKLLLKWDPPSGTTSTIGGYQGRKGRKEKWRLEFYQRLAYFISYSPYWLNQCNTTII